MKQADKKIFPVWGYVVLNLAFTGLMVAVYLGSVFYARRNHFTSAGMFPIVLVCWLSFIAVSIGDAVYDRFSSKPRQAKPEATDGAAKEEL